jgi:hypothetical protein
MDRQVLGQDTGVGRNRAMGREAAKWTALTAGALWEVGLLNVGLKIVLKLLAAVEQDADVMTATLRVQAVGGVPNVLKENLKELLTRPTSGVSDLNLAASVASLRVNEFTWAKTFWYRHLEHLGAQSVLPESPPALYDLWAKDLQRRGLSLRSGFGFDPDRHLPATAMECLLMILKETPEDLPTLRQMDGVLRPVPGTGQTRVGYLSILTLFERNDWRLALEIALANLATYRLESGLEELHLARELAVKAGQESAFLRVLKGRDLSGLLAERLGA